MSDLDCSSVIPVKVQFHAERPEYYSLMEGDVVQVLSNEIVHAERY